MKTPWQALFARNLATLLGAGVPLLRALDVLHEQERSAPGRRFLDGLRGSVRAGNTLSGALAEAPRGQVLPLLVHLSRAGEASGALPAVLDRMATHLERMQALRAQVQNALLYPLIVLLLTAGVVTVLFTFVVPRFEILFANLLPGEPLPALTRGLLAFSAGLAHALPFLLLALAVALVLGGGLQRRSAAFARASGAFLDGLPGIGPLRREAALARLLQTLATLLQSGLGLLPALELSARASGAGRLEGELWRAHVRVRDGESLSAALRDARALPPLVCTVLAVGEESGRLPTLLAHVAEAHESAAERAARRLSALVEPLLVAALAGVVGVVAVALFLPLVTVLERFGL